MKNGECMLNPSVSKTVSKILKFKADLDFLVLRHSHQLPNYVFINQTLLHIWSTNSQGTKKFTNAICSLLMIVVLKWAFQSWYNNFRQLCHWPCIVEPNKTNLLLSQKQEEMHQLWLKLSLQLGKTPGLFY